MNQDRSDVTQEPTVKRLRKAREDGNVARSSDLSTVLFLIAAICVIIVWIPKSYTFMHGLLVENLSESSIAPKALLETAGWSLLELLAIPCIILLVAAAFSGVLQVGGLFSPSVAVMKLSRIAFSGGGKFIGARGRMSIMFSIAKLVFASGASLLVLLHFKNKLMQIGTSGTVIEQVTEVGSVAVLVVFFALFVLLVLGLADLAWQRHIWKYELRMTRQEIIEEHKENAGNAGIVRRNTASLVKKCVHKMIPSLIVVGDEIAVSVRWNATTMSSPVVLDIFQEEEYLLYAEQLEGVNIIQDNSLASKIINTSDVGLGIPPALHGEIASLLITSRRDA